MLDLGKDLAVLKKLKNASADAGIDAQASNDMSNAIAELLEKDTLSIFDIFIAALASEKISEYEKAICYYSKCIELLPESALRHAISGMKNRVKSKMEPATLNNYVAAALDFEAAAKMEKVPWRIDKWKTAGEEMKRQQILQWREH